MRVTDDEPAWAEALQDVAELLFALASGVLVGDAVEHALAIGVIRSARAGRIS